MFLKFPKKDFATLRLAPLTMQVPKFGKTNPTEQGLIFGLWDVLFINYAALSLLSWAMIWSNSTKMLLKVYMRVFRQLIQVIWVIF